MIDDIIKKERERNKDNIDKIYLFRDGNSAWYKAYEWSAYLMEFFPNGLKDKLKPVHKYYKGLNGTAINVGLQLKSLDKFVPFKTIVNTNETMMEIEIDLSSYGDKLTGDNFVEKLENWKKSVEISNKSDNTKKSQNIFSNQISFFKIFKEVLNYDTYGKSEDDLRNFILELRRMCADMIF